MPGNTTRRYPPELKERACEFAEIMPQHESEWAAMGQVAELLGIRTPETAEVGAPNRDRRWARSGTSTEEAAEVRRLKCVVAEHNARTPS